MCRLPFRLSALNLRLLSFARLRQFSGFRHLELVERDAQSSPTLTFFFFEDFVSNMRMSLGRRTEICRCSSAETAKRSKLNLAMANRTTSLVEAKPSLV